MSSVQDGARAVLETNDTGDMIVGAPDLYPHQWLWDAALNAIGLANLDWPRAVAEIESVFKGQWRGGSNAGFLAHIRFNPEAEVAYFPGPDVWMSECFSGLSDTRTSGITQPPVLAHGVRRLFELCPSQAKGFAFLNRVYGPLVSYHRWLRRARDPHSEGLVFITHPWESGLDNSPQFDVPMRNIEDIPERVRSLVDSGRRDHRVVSAGQRPTQDDYYRYIHLVASYRDIDYDVEEIAQRAEFRVQEVAFNTIWCRANEDLAAVARLLGEEEDAATFTAWSEQTRQAVQGKLWNPRKGMYYSFDLRTEQILPVDTISGCMPLFAGIPGEAEAALLLGHLESPDEFNLTYPVCSTSRKEPVFDPDNYWRGPSWVVINWFIINGLERYPGPCRDFASYLRGKTIEMVENGGFWEYFNPFTGEGRGMPDYSWTAALAVDLASA